MKVDLFEHAKTVLIALTSEQNNEVKIEDYNAYKSVKPRTFIDKRNNIIPRYKIYEFENEIRAESNYYIGLDWIITNKRFVYVAPKINNKLIEKFNETTEKEADVFSDNEDSSEQHHQPNNYQELDYLSMFLDATTHPEILNDTEGLLTIDWEAPEIEIEQRDDILTPFLVIQFLNLLQQIVRKGLKKSYYDVQRNLSSSIKGKILVGQNIKTNIVKNKLTQTLCAYQEFGIDNNENRFLKKVLRFVFNYIANNKAVFQNSYDNLIQIVNYCQPAFEYVSTEIKEHELKHIKANVFFKEYKESIKIGQYILKRFAYNISTISNKKVSTPPFWIDMPRLFELYVYKQLLETFPNEVRYHFKTYGNEIDFLITTQGNEIVIDAKYKLHYKNGHIHQDIRQVSGYARLNKTYDELKIEEDKIIDCLIIYPDLMGADKIPKELLSNPIKAYRKMYKLGIKLPLIEKIKG